MPKQEYECKICKKIKYKYASTVRGQNFFCSKECQALYQKNNFTGENNPNFGKKWTEDKKTSQKQLILSKVTDEYRHRCGNANRGKTLTEDQKRKISDSTKGKKKGPHSKKSKELIGAASRNKWTPDYKKRHRLKMESIGKWLPLDQKDDYEIYYQESNWVRFMFDIVDKELFNKHGVWHHSNNKSGLVRDHKYSRKTGFKNKVFPEILRHPANCGLISHSENIRIAQSGADDVITLEELFVGIQQYDKYWFEQELCLNLITDYLSGKTWMNKHKKGGVSE